MNSPSPAWAGGSGSRDSAEAEDSSSWTSYLSPSTGWQIFQWGPGMTLHPSWPCSLGDISMPTVGTGRAISCDTQNRYVQR